VAGSAARVLVADDEPDLLDLLRETLAAQGYDVMTAVTGAEALAAVSSFCPDVLIVDIAMPGLSGREVLDRLRESGSGIPIVAISGDAGGAGEGFFGVLQKPFSFPVLTRTVAEAVASIAR
jgi:two-component system KDP operon response regulator KdpE